MMENIATPYIPILLALVQVAFVVRDILKARDEKRKLQAEARKTDAEAANEQGGAVQSIVNAAGSLATAQTNTVESLVKRLDHLEKSQVEQEKRNEVLARQVRRYAQRIAYLMGGIDQLLNQIAANNLAPVWRPNDWSIEEE